MFHIEVNVHVLNFFKKNKTKNKIKEKMEKKKEKRKK
jgi:hypothetical protein